MNKRMEKHEAEYTQDVSKKTEYRKNVMAIPMMIILLFIAICIILASNHELNMSSIIPQLVSEQPFNMEYDEVKDGEENTSSEYVKFDAFFLKDRNGDGIADGVRGTCNAVGGEDTLYINLQVLTEGYLKDGKITIGTPISGKTAHQKNFYLKTDIPKDTEIKVDYISDNTQIIELNQINNGTQKLITGKVRAGKYELDGSLLYATSKEAIGTNEENYSRVNTITLEGIHVQELADGTIQETKIKKSVDIQVDWYGEMKIDFYFDMLSQDNRSDTIYDETKKELNVKVNFHISDLTRQLLHKEFHIEGTLPQIKGYSPIRVEACDNYTTIEYNQSTRKFIVKQQRKQHDSYPSMYINIVYPEQAYTAIKGTDTKMNIPLEIYLLGYNNPQEGYTNPYKSNVLKNTISVKIDGKAPWMAIPTIAELIYTPSLERVISKEKALKIYKGISNKEDDESYNVTASVYTEQINSNEVLKLKEKEKMNDGKTSIENIRTNVGVNIYSSPNNDLLEDGGYIKIYNDVTNEEIATITKQDLIANPNRYTNYLYKTSREYKN